MSATYSVHSCFLFFCSFPYSFILRASDQDKQGRHLRSTELILKNRYAHTHTHTHIHTHTRANVHISLRMYPCSLQSLTFCLLMHKGLQYGLLVIEESIWTAHTWTHTHGHTHKKRQGHYNTVHVQYMYKVNVHNVRLSSLICKQTLKHFLIPNHGENKHTINGGCKPRLCGAVAHVMTGSLQGCRVKQQASNSYV